MILTELLRHAMQQCAAPVDAEYLLMFCIQKPRSFLYTHPDYIPTSVEVNHYHALIQKRQAGWPIAYLTGHRAFYKLDFKVTPHTLIPRSETELLVERVLFHIQHSIHPAILELGTGTGAIALSIAQMHPDVHITACDIDQQALSVAQDNAKTHHIHHVQFIESDWFSSITGRYDVIVSNPPYLAIDSPYLKEGDLRFEPQHALISGHQGLDAITHLIQNSPPYLRAGGYLCLEHGYDQAIAVQKLFQKRGYTAITTFQDLARHPRMTEATWTDA